MPHFCVCVHASKQFESMFESSFSLDGTVDERMEVLEGLRPLRR